MADNEDFISGADYGEGSSREASPSEELVESQSGVSQGAVSEDTAVPEAEDMLNPEMQAQTQLDLLYDGVNGPKPEDDELKEIPHVLHQRMVDSFEGLTSKDKFMKNIRDAQSPISAVNVCGPCSVNYHHGDIPAKLCG